MRLIFVDSEDAFIAAPHTGSLARLRCRFKTGWLRVAGTSRFLSPLLTCLRRVRVAPRVCCRERLGRTSIRVTKAGV